MYVRISLFAKYICHLARFLHFRRPVRIIQPNFLSHFCDILPDIIVYDTLHLETFSPGLPHLKEYDIVWFSLFFFTSPPHWNESNFLKIFITLTRYINCRKIRSEAFAIRAKASVMRRREGIFCNYFKCIVV